MSGGKVRLWVRGLIAAVISGAAGGLSAALSAMIVAPDQFNLGTHGMLVKMIVLPTIISSAIGLMAYLKQSPLPPA